MTIEAPEKISRAALTALWMEAFGDRKEDIDLFFETAYSPDRCRFLTVDGQLASALYWMDCFADGQKLAYLYAVATGEKFRGRGLCRKLMDDTHRELKSKGYAGAILVPGDEGLFRMYEKLGYACCGSVTEFTCEAGARAVTLKRLDAKTYAQLRRTLLPAGGVVQEGENLAYLAAYAALYCGDGFCAALVQEGTRVQCAELLGNARQAPGILAALGAKTGVFRTSGAGRPFAMYHPLSGKKPPTYFGLAFD